ncbi:hypothetical protein JYT72_00265 [Crocinitomix catalasitica]|nr:hypothetical protein [Crocinitomix catalasitica]
MTMTTLTLKNRRILILQLLVVALLFTSCRNNTEVNRAVHVFFLGVMQILNMALFGILGLIFSILAQTGGKQGLRIAGVVLSIVFALGTIAGLLNLAEWHPRHYEIYTLFGISVIMIIVSLIYSFKSMNEPRKTVKSQGNDKYLDDIISEEEEEII